MYSKSLSAAFAATLFATANAHFFIKSPAPIPGSGIKDPLDPSGSNFPCHGVDVSQGSVTPLTAGSSQQLEYELGNGANTAVHGGGSCQISLTYETDPAALKDPANWKVIQSFIGGCPTNAPGNLPTAVMCDGSNGPNCVNALSFGVPQEVQNGQAILAWTWFNNIGNREMYMNCAKVDISGGSGQMGSLPSMAVANLASINSCTTTENFNVDFPDPGQYVTTSNPLNYPKKLMQGSGCGTGSGSTGGTTPSTPSTPSTPGGSTGGGSTGGDGSTGGTPATGGDGSTGGSPTTTSSANNGQYTGAPSSGNGGSGNGGSGNGQPGGPGAGSGNPGGIFAPGASPTATNVATTFVTSAAVPAATGSAPSTGGSTGGSTGACLTGQVPCTASGFYCIDASTFGMCNWGCAVPQQMAGGTECSLGQVKAIALPQKEKRSHPRHLHARAHQVRHVSPLL